VSVANSANLTISRLKVRLAAKVLALA